ncbi:MAG TPA: cadherin-like domain-containing protein, partial [Patescibacteria group bacterium]|nr:cadherin-like domain-containing protein [Patescibacteria group bacterium]
MSRRRPAAWLAIALLLTGAIAPASVVAASPECPNDSVSIDEDGSASGNLACTDADGDSLTYALETGAGDGQATVQSDGSFTYNPSPDFNGSDAFTYSASDGTDTSVPATISITIHPVNDAPSFTKGADQTVAENASTKTVSNWATAISKGPPDESGQALDFVVTNDNTGLFAIQPAVSASGTLTFKPASSTSGDATVSVTLTDDGGTARGGEDTSPTRTFTITVTGTNDPPSFTPGGDQTVLEDSGSQSVNNWATSISAGPPDESSQSLNFVVDANTNTALFSSQPAVNSTGRLTYTPASNANGSADITLHLHD